MGWAVAIAIAYLLLSARGEGTTARRAPAPTSSQATAQTGVGGTQITLPGVGSYTNIPGVVSSITIDPRIFGLNPAAPQPEPNYYPNLVAPQLSTDYIPEAQLDPPIRLVAPNGVQLPE